MSNILVGLLAYLIDRLFGEFRFVRHPIILIGLWISWFEKKFYKDSVIRGIILLLTMMISLGLITGLVVWLIALLPFWTDMILSSSIASMFLAHKMLRDEVYKLTTAKEPKDHLATLVSRDTAELTDSDVYKAGIETYAENLSDGVIAPFFYLLLFGLPGIVIYKTVNTLDSMVGYRTKRYEKYGKASARMDDLLNFIPSRLTAAMIMLLSKPLSLFAFYVQGKAHASPNAGHTITAMALAIDVRLGGPTRYFGKLKEKAFFGKGKILLSAEDIKRALKVGQRVDLFILLLLSLALFSNVQFFYELRASLSDLKSLNGL